MPLYRDAGVVIRTHKLGEADRIITLLMLHRGLVRAVAKGVRRTSSKFGARLEPFMVADLQCYEGRTLDTVTQAVTLGSYGPPISADFDRYRAGSVMVESAERLSEGGPAPEQFHLLVGGLRTLAQGTIPADLVRDSYLLRALAAAGWTPELGSCVRCGNEGTHTYFSAQLGGLVCEDCRAPGTPRVREETVILLRALLAGDWDTVLESAPKARDQAAALTAAYAQWQLERGLKSLRGR